MSDDSTNGDKIMTVHAIPADFEDKLGRDAAATTEAAQASPRVESNVTAPNEAPGTPVPDDQVAEYQAPYGPVETATAPTDGIETRD